MDVYFFNLLPLSDQVLLISLKGRFIAERQSCSCGHQAKLFSWGNYFLEVYYRWPANRGASAYWEPYKVCTFGNETGSVDRLMPYVELINLGELPINITT